MKFDQDQKVEFKKSFKLYRQISLKVLGTAKQVKADLKPRISLSVVNCFTSCAAPAGYGWFNLV